MTIRIWLWGEVVEIEREEGLLELWSRDLGWDSVFSGLTYKEYREEMIRVNREMEMEYEKEFPEFCACGGTSCDGTCERGTQAFQERLDDENFEILAQTEEERQEISDSMDARGLF